MSALIHNNLRQDIIEALIFEGKASAFELATLCRSDPFDVFDELEAMRADGVARIANWESLDDDGDEFDGEYILLAESHEAEPEHFVNWEYCGGPVSKALAEANQ